MSASVNTGPVNTSEMTKTIAISSGKGGVGKSTLTANIALELAKEGKKVLIFDGDMGMANIDIMFGRRTNGSIADFLAGQKKLEDVLLPVAENIDLLPGGSGIRSLVNLSDIERRNLLDQISYLPSFYDYMLVDTAPGIGDNVLYLNSAANESNIIITPDPSSLTDSYALIKVLHQTYRETRFKVICNMVKDEQEAKFLYKRLSDVASRFLHISLDYVGHIPNDFNLRNATKTQHLVLQSHPNSPSAIAIRRIADNLKSFEGLEFSKGGIRIFWENYFGVA